MDSNAEPTIATVYTVLSVSLFLVKWLALSLCPTKPWKERLLVPLSVSLLPSLFEPVILGQIFLITTFRLNPHYRVQFGLQYTLGLLVVDTIALGVARIFNRATVFAIVMADLLFGFAANSLFFSWLTY